MSLRVLIHDVGHGQAVHIFTPAGETIVIDLGCSGVFSPIEWLSASTKMIDSLIITHPHGDHIDEFLLLKKLGFSVRQLWRPKWLPKATVYEQNQSTYKDKLDAYFEMSDRYSSPIAESERVGNPAVSGGVSIDKFASKSVGTSNINNHSGVVVVKYRDISLVIPGDNEPASWRALLQQPSFAEAMAGAHIFMASHHGRESGYCSDIFESKPWLCVVSDGRVQDTDARERYSYHATGWTPIRRSGQPTKERSCLTTRSDGFVQVEVGENSNGKTYFRVEID